MRTMKCPTCGGTCRYEIGQGYVCEACMNIYGAEEISDKIIDKLNYANEKRRDHYDFDGALQLCLEILEEQPNNQEANWGALLAEYQIVYLKNAKGEYKPTFLNPDVSTPIDRCKYYNKLNTDFRRMADLAETVRLEVVRESNRIPDYDVFISYKQHVGNSDTIMTEEAEWAALIYKRLVKCGLRVFYDEESLKGGAAGWEPHIYSALKSSKYLILLGSSLDNINSTWVKNEWKRYLSYRKKDSDKTFSVAQKNCKPEDLDYDLQSQQVLDANDSDWMDILVKNVNDYFVKYNITYLLAEAQTFLAKRKFKKAKENYQKVCSANPRNSKGYWGLLMCRFKAMDDFDLVKCRKRIGKTVEYDNAAKYAQGEEKERYEKVCNDNLTHNIVGYDRINYKKWQKETRVQRFFKRLAIIVLVLAIGTTTAYSGYSVYDKKSREYTLLLDYGEAVGNTASLTIYSGEDIPRLPGQLVVADKDYVDFAGWFTQPDCKGIQVAGADGKSEIKTDNIISLSNVSHQIKVYAGFALHKYTVTFYDAEGQTILKSVKAEHGTALEDIASEIYMGEQLAITWSLQPSGVEFNGKIEKDLLLYATSFAIKVKYDSNGGNDFPDEIVRVGDKIPMPTPERQYYGFEGWAYKDQIIEYGFVAPKENITLVAQWSKTHFTLTLDSNGGLEDKSEIVKAGNTVSLPVLSRQYYRFLGWEYNGSIVDNSFIMPSKDIILTAKWEKTHYAVTLDGETQYIRVGESIILPSLTRTGYIFKGWRCGDRLYQGSYVPQDDMTFTSDWKAEEYTVTLNSNGGELSQSTATVTYSSVYKLPVPTRDGYKFAGWYTSTDSSGRQVTNNQGSSTSVWSYTTGKTLYAIWTKDYEIKLTRESCKDGNGYDPSAPGTSVDSLAHHDWDILNLVIGGCVQEADGSYFIPDGTLLSVSFKVLQNLGALPTWGMNGVSANWTKHWMSSDSYSGNVYGTNINNQAVGYGAYYVKITYTDGTTYETNKVNFMSGAKASQVINVPLNLNVNKKIKSLDVVAVYELYYDYMNSIWDWNGTKCIANWRCTGSIKFS